MWRPFLPQLRIGREIGRAGWESSIAPWTALKRKVAVKLLPPELAFRAISAPDSFAKPNGCRAQPIISFLSITSRSAPLVYSSCFTLETTRHRSQDEGAMDPEPGDLRDIGRTFLRTQTQCRSPRHQADNILLDEDTGRAMVTDFGIARALRQNDSRLTDRNGYWYARVHVAGAVRRESRH